MARVDFLISNSRHHRSMTWPVMERLGEIGQHRCRVLSLCELRGIRSPPADDAPRGAVVRRLLPLHLRRSSALGRPASPAGAGRARGALQELAWRLLIAPRLARLQREPPDLVVLPNDAAYPYERIAARLRRAGAPFLLLQEGIRFPLPAVGQGVLYGAGGAAAVAAWGAVSGSYFRSVGVPAERIHLTGSPRFDPLRAPRDENERRQARLSLGLTRRTVCWISNPIDDQGFCTREAKMSLFADFVRGIEPLFADPEFHLAVKLHARESAADFERRIPEPLRPRISLLGHVSLYQLLIASRAAIVLASTVGLEALLCGVPLAVVEIPGHGFQYDYVQSGVAAGLAWDAPMSSQLATLLEPSLARQREVEAYLERQFSHRNAAARQVAELIHSQIGG